MSKVYGIAAGSLIALALALACFSIPSKAQQGGVAERAGEKLDEVGRAIRDGFEKAGETVVGGINKTGETVREGLVRARDSVQGMGVWSRVYSRLHWDKAFHTTNILLRADGGVVTLRGTVADEAARAKVVALTGETVGVTRVIDQLNVLHLSTESTPSASRRSGRASSRQIQGAPPER
jgi:hypothetical protein